MANKMTKRDYFTNILNKYPLTEDEKKFVQNELDLLAKKNSSKKPTATQVANESIKNAILDGLDEGVKYTITDIMKSVPACADLTNQKVSAIVKQMVECGVITRIEDKRKAYFTLA